MATVTFDVWNDHSYDQAKGGKTLYNGNYYLNLNTFNSSPGGPYGQVYTPEKNNGYADTFVIDLSGLSEFDSSQRGGLQVWVDGDSAYNDDADPNTWDSFQFVLPEGWTLYNTYKSPSRGGTYWDLRDENNNPVNFGPGPDQIWVAGNASSVSFVNICFAQGTRLLCADGEWRAVDDIEEGDLVMTKDAGLQPVKWAGHSPVSRETLEQFPNRRPIVFEPGAVGNTERLRVSPQHRMLVTGAVDGGPAEERLVPAKHLVNDHNIFVDNSCEPVSYYHIMMDEHQIVKSEGAWSESFWPGAYIRDAMDPMAWSQVEFYFPELATNKNPEEAYGKPAREFLKRKHVEVFLNTEVA